MPLPSSMSELLSDKYISNSGKTTTFILDLDELDDDLKQEYWVQFCEQLGKTMYPSGEQVYLKIN